MNETLLTPAEAAQRFRVSVDTIRRLLRNKKMRGVRVGGQWRVPEESVQRLFAPRVEETVVVQVDTWKDLVRLAREAGTATTAEERRAYLEAIYMAIRGMLGPGDRTDEDAIYQAILAKRAEDKV